VTDLRIRDTDLRIRDTDLESGILILESGILVLGLRCVQTININSIEFLPCFFANLIKYEEEHILFIVRLNACGGNWLNIEKMSYLDSLIYRVHLDLTVLSIF